MAHPGTAGDGESAAREKAVPRHEIERAVARLNQWFAENRERIPRGFCWRSFRRQRCVPRFRAVRTNAIKEWTSEELGQLYRVVRGGIQGEGEPSVVPIELLVVDRSPGGAFLDTRKVLKAARDAFAANFFLGKFSPRLWWFWFHYESLAEEIETYVGEIRLRVDAATPIPHNQRRVFEDFSVPLENGQQTAIGKGCMFILDRTQPHGGKPYWRFTVEQHGEPIVGPSRLLAKPIYHRDELLAVVRNVTDTAVTLSVLTSDG